MIDIYLDIVNYSGVCIFGFKFMNLNFIFIRLNEFRRRINGINREFSFIYLLSKVLE